MTDGTDCQPSRAYSINVPISRRQESGYYLLPPTSHLGLFRFTATWRAPVASRAHQLGGLRMISGDGSNYTLAEFRYDDCSSLILLVL